MEKLWFQLREILNWDFLAQVVQIIDTWGYGTKKHPLELLYGWPTEKNQSWIG
jgi:hypothetical protein